MFCVHSESFQGALQNCDIHWCDHDEHQQLLLYLCKLPFEWSTMQTNCCIFRIPNEKIEFVRGRNIDFNENLARHIPRGLFRWKAFWYYSWFLWNIVASSKHRYISSISDWFTLQWCQNGLQRCLGKHSTSWYESQDYGRTYNAIHILRYTCGLHWWISGSGIRWSNLCDWNEVSLALKCRSKIISSNADDAY